MRNASVLRVRCTSTGWTPLEWEMEAAIAAHFVSKHRALFIVLVCAFGILHLLHTTRAMRHSPFDSQNFRFFDLGMVNCLFWTARKHENNTDRVELIIAIFLSFDQFSFCESEPANRPATLTIPSNLNKIWMFLMLFTLHSTISIERALLRH